jgi:hypothetical protein
MSHQPERRHSRPDDELRNRREALRRQWDAKQRRSAPAVAVAIAVPDVTAHDIAVRAYELFEQRGGAHGHDVEDWLQAERELRPSSRVTAA